LTNTYSLDSGYYFNLWHSANRKSHNIAFKFFSNNIFQTMEQPSIINVYVYYNPVETNGAVPSINFNPEGTQHHKTFTIT